MLQKISNGLMMMVIMYYLRLMHSQKRKVQKPSKNKFAYLKVETCALKNLSHHFVIPFMVMVNITVFPVYIKVLSSSALFLHL